jgi:hypothetical protein
VDEQDLLIMSMSYVSRLTKCNWNQEAIMHHQVLFLASFKNLNVDLKLYTS